MASVLLLAALPLIGCGNALEGGSQPSGSYIRIEGITPANFEPDIFLSICSSTVDAEGVVTNVFEPGITNTYATVRMRNDSAPNTPTGQSTNSFVTMNRYRVDFTGLNKTVRIPSIDGGGQSVGIAPGDSGEMTVLVMDFATLEHIRNRYPSIGNTESLTLRAKITIWGTDAFQVQVSTEAEITLVVDEYDRC